jgi:dTMP kinase
MNKENFFLVIEGLDGSGKTEISRRLAHMYETKFKEKVLLTFEPHDASCAGLYIRQVLMKRIPEQQFSHLGLALAFAANRLDHYYREILPFLQGEQKIVICDRYYLSSLVYQTRDDLLVDDVMYLNRGAIKPDLTIFLNASNKVCFERMEKRAQDKELFEKKLSETRDSYKQAIEFLRTNRNEIVEEVNADKSINEVLDQVIECINTHAPNWMTLQQLLPLDYDSENNFYREDQYTSNSFFITNILKNIYEMNPIKTIDDLTSAIYFIENMIQTQLSNCDNELIISLFLEYLKQNNYELGEKYPYSDISAYELNFNLPLGLIQNGMLLISNSYQREDAIVRKVVSSSFKHLNFIIVFNPISSISFSYFESESIVTNDKTFVSPVIKRFNKDEVRKFCLNFAITHFSEEFINSIRSDEELNKYFNEYCRVNNINLFFDFPVSISA